MGIDGIEFHKSYHRNLGTFQDAWLVRNFFGLKFSAPPWWESVGQVESVEKS